jgi:hypothetical protein
MEIKKQKIIDDVPLTLTAIDQFRKILDIMEEFIMNTEKERLEEQQV